MPSIRDPKESFYVAAEAWRHFIRGAGEELLAAVDWVDEAVNVALATKDPDKRRANVADIGSEIREVAEAGAKAYKWFASGREAIYDAALVMEIDTKRKSVGNKTKPLTGMSTEALMEEIDEQVSALQTGMLEMLDLGAKTQKRLRVQATNGEELEKETAEKLINASLDFRDQVSVACFAQVNGIMRRAVELSNRAWSEMRAEDIAADWRAPWANDPEFGDREA